MTSIQIKNPTGTELTVLNRKILPWEKAHNGQTVEIEASRAADFISQVTQLNGSIKAEIVAEKAEMPKAKAEPKAEAEPKAKAKPKKSTTTEKAESE